MRLSVACVLLLLAVPFPLLLNSQEFTNSIVGIVFGVCSVIVANAAYNRASASDRKRVWCVATAGLGVLWVALLALGLPRAYAYQARFNEHVEKVQQRDERRAIEQQRVESRNSQGKHEESNYR